MPFMMPCPDVAYHKRKNKPDITTMTYEHFLQLILAHKKATEQLIELFDMGIDLIGHKYDIADPIDKMLEAAIVSHYGKAGYDWVSWYIYENEYGQRDWSELSTLVKHEDGSVSMGESKWHGATDENGNPICHSFESLHEFLTSIA
jgi:thiamine biosynthesis protein ThiC